MSTSLYTGIDIGKSGHVAAFLSEALLHKHKRYESCPTLGIKQSRADFETLLRKMCQHAPPEHCHILMERTGHYGVALEQFLQEHGCHLYRINPGKRYGKNKTDKHDAQALSVILYNQVELHSHVIDRSMRIHPIIAPPPLARTLHSLVQHRFELSQEVTQRENKLTAICDELFPEFTQACKMPNAPSALVIRAAFPTPQAMDSATLEELCAARRGCHYPSRATLTALQELARETIGTKDEYRRKGLIIAQEQLIDELQLLRRHVDELDADISAAIADSRDAKILMSFIGIGPVQAATIIACTGTIANFESASQLRGYIGWSPRRSQTGTSFDSTVLSKGGNVLLKQSMLLIVMNATRYDPQWKALYDRLIPIKCHYDERAKKYRGKMKVIGRVAGQIISVIFLLLKRDYDLLASLPPGEEPPPPELRNPRVAARSNHANTPSQAQLQASRSG
jgi:transposase